MKKKLLLIMLGIVFLALFLFVSGSDIFFQDDFTGGVKPEWEIESGSWIYNSTLNAYSTNKTNYVNALNVNFPIPDDNYVEFKIIHVDPDVASFNILTRVIWCGAPCLEGYGIVYDKTWAQFFHEPLRIVRFTYGEGDQYLDAITWDELDGFDDVTDFEGHTIGIEVQGDVIKGYLDGVEILSATHDTHTNGTASVYSNPKDGVFIFDDFKIEAEFIPPSTNSYGFGTTSFSEEDAQGTTNLTLETEYGKIEFPENYTVYVHAEDYDNYIEIGDKFVSVNSTELHSSFNNLSTITLKGVTCPITPYFKNSVYPSATEIISGGSPCDASTTPSCTNIQCINNTLTFTVSGFSSYAAPNYNNVTLILESDYTAPPYTNVTLVLGVPPVVECTPTLDVDWVITDAQVCDAKEVTTGTGEIYVTATGNLTLINAANVTTTKIHITGPGDKVFINQNCEIRIQS